MQKLCLVLGCNTFLHWSALQDTTFSNPRDNNKNIWSGMNMFKDLELALCLQVGLLSQLGKNAVFLIAHV